MKDWFFTDNGVWSTWEKEFMEDEIKTFFSFKYFAFIFFSEFSS